MARAVEVYRQQNDGPLRDLLADLMHYADAYGIDWERELESATMHHAAEVGEQGAAVADWRYEVVNGDTVLGYSDWVLHQQEAAR